MSKQFAAVALIASLLTMAACARRETQHEIERESTPPRASRDTTSAYTNPAAVPHPSPPQPAGPQVGKTDSIMNAAARRLNPWVRMWQASLPGFKPDSLYHNGMRPALRGGYVQPLRNIYPPDPEHRDVFSVLSAMSPDGRYKLVFDWYQYIGENEGDIETGGEPDSAPLLLDLRFRTSNQFEFCGTPCAFDWGVWLSPTSFALGGWQDADEYGQWKQGRFSIYSIPDSTASSYVTRIISAENFVDYRAAWKAWVAARYRALKGVEAPDTRGPRSDRR
jgi:hypothetical protein